MELGRDLLGGFRQRHPGLHSMHVVATGADVAGRALGVGDATTGGHPVDVARRDDLFRPQRIAVVNRARPEEGHRGQPDMRMRAHIDAAPRLEHRRTHVVDEHERPHAAGLQAGNGAAHVEAVAKVVHAGRNDGRHGRFLGERGEASHGTSSPPATAGKRIVARGLSRVGTRSCRPVAWVRAGGSRAGYAAPRPARSASIRGARATRSTDCSAACCAAPSPSARRDGSVACVRPPAGPVFRVVRTARSSPPRYWAGR